MAYSIVIRGMFITARKIVNSEREVVNEMEKLADMFDAGSALFYNNDKITVLELEAPNEYTRLYAYNAGNNQLCTMEVTPA